MCKYNCLLDWLWACQTKNWTPWTKIILPRKIPLCELSWQPALPWWQLSVLRGVMVRYYCNHTAWQSDLNNFYSYSHTCRSLGGLAELGLAHSCASALAPGAGLLFITGLLIEAALLLVSSLEYTWTSGISELCSSQRVVEKQENK